jgi:hypothetical protein
MYFEDLFEMTARSIEGTGPLTGARQPLRLCAIGPARRVDKASTANGLAVPPRTTKSGKRFLFTLKGDHRAFLLNTNEPRAKQPERQEEFLKCSFRRCDKPIVRVA